MRQHRFLRLCLLLAGLAGAGSGAAQPLPLRGQGGPVAVLESGLGGDPLPAWEGLLPWLEPCLTLALHDRAAPGGAVPPAEGAVLAADVAEALRVRLRESGLPPPYLLVGHSLGGLYIQAFARANPGLVAGMVLVDAASPLEPPGVFVPTVPPIPGSREAAEEEGVAASAAAMLAGPPLPPVPLRVLVATDHADTPAREALWQEVQRRTAALSPRGRMVRVESGHFIQSDRPDAVADSILQVASEAGLDVSACRSR